MTAAKLVMMDETKKNIGLMPCSARIQFLQTCIRKEQSAPFIKRQQPGRHTNGAASLRQNRKQRLK